MSKDWTIEEVTLIVKDYFDMLFKELSGQNYVKAEHRRKLLKFLRNRTEGSIEYKHQNISAVLIELKLPYITGYKPAFNYQNLLRDIVIDYVNSLNGLDDLIEDFASKEVDAPTAQNLLNRKVSIPEFSFQIGETHTLKNYTSDTDYYKKEIQNKVLGFRGEEFVISYEKQRLSNLGLDSLSKKIEHIAQTEGDSAGFDILSYDESGKEKFIEVKTTKMGIASPFYFTRNEFGFSKSHASDYQLFRVFNFQKLPKFYQLEGSLDTTCESIPTEYIGWPK